MCRIAWAAAGLAVLCMAFPVAAEDAPLPRVDVGVRELPLGELRVLAPRTEADWWAVARTWERPGPVDPRSLLRVFRGTDAGRSWRGDPEAAAALRRGLDGYSDTGAARIDFLVWYTPETGIAAGELGPRVLRTTDGGRTWVGVALPGNSVFHALARAGGRTWLCGTSGQLVRSDDDGASWQALRGTPFKGLDPCVALSFSSAEQGWALGEQGSLWATEDGGVSWRRLEAPSADIRGRYAGPDAVLARSHVVRLTAEVGWAAGPGGRFQTVDGGRTWRSRPPPPGEERAGRGIATLEGGRRVITVGQPAEGAPVDTWVPASGKRAVLMGGDTVVTYGAHAVRTHAAGRVVREGTLVSKGTGTLTPLEGVARKSSTEWLGWTGAQVFASNDGGGSWFGVGRLPEQPLREAVFLADGRVLARTGAGRLLVSQDFGRTWKRNTGWMEPYDFAVASGQQPLPESPVDCLLTAAEARVKVEFGFPGEFGGMKSELVLELSPGGTQLSGVNGEGSRPGSIGVRKPPREEALRILRSLVEAARRQETPGGCVPSSASRTVLEWSCEPRRAWRPRQELWATNCGGPSNDAKDILGEPVTAGAEDAQGYARARGLEEAAARVLQDASR